MSAPADPPHGSPRPVAPRRDPTWLRAGALLVLAAAGVAAVLLVDLPAAADVRAWLDRTGIAGLVLLAVGTGIALLGPVPRTALSVLLGVAAGSPAGLAVAVAGGLLGGAAAFALGRRLGRPAVARLAGPRLASADRLLGARGFGSVLALRLLPVAPFTAVSYAAGLSAVRPRPYLAATALGLLPGTVVQVGAGASVAHLDAGAELLTGPWATALLAVALTAAVVLAVRRRRRAPG